MRWGPTLALGMVALGAGCADATGPSANEWRLYYLDFDSYSTYDPTLFAQALDGSTPVPIVRESELGGIRLDTWQPIWASRDGSSFIVMGSREETGGVFLSITREGALVGEVPYSEEFNGWGPPSISPDGARVAWFRGGWLHLADLDGGHHKQIYFDSLAWFSNSVAWSPDGESLAYVHGFGGVPPYWGPVTDLQVWTVRLADGQRRQVTRTAGDKRDPTWSRNGRHIAYVEGAAVHRVEASGGNDVIAFQRPVRSLGVSWGPGDQLLAFVGEDRVQVIRPDGTAGQAVATVVNTSEVAWGR